MKIYPRLALVVPLLACCVAAQTPDKLALKNGSTLIGVMPAFTCAASPGDQRVSFQLAGTTPAVSAGLSEMAQIQLGDVMLVSDSAPAPSASDATALKAYLHAAAAARSTAAVQVKRLSLAATLPYICDAPAPAAGIFHGSVGINGSDTFGATVQRLISGDLAAYFYPAKATLGSTATIVQLGTSYGDTIKGSVTTKSSQVDYGKLILETRLNGATKLNFTADEYHSFSQGVKLEQGYGAGISYLLNQQLTVQADIWAMHDTFFHPAAGFASPAAHFRESDTVGAGKRVSLTEEFEAIAPFDSARALILRGQANLGIKIVSGVTANLIYSDNYLRNSPKGYKPNYVKLTLGVAYSW